MDAANVGEFIPFMVFALHAGAALALEPMALERKISVDPSRLIQGLVGGTGFREAGAIIGGGSEGRLPRRQRRCDLDRRGA